MKEFCKVLSIASRGRGDNNAQHFEARADYCTNTITSVYKDCMFLIIDNKDVMIRFPCILQKTRSEEGKKIRRQYKNDIGVPYQACKVQLPKTDGICPTLTQSFTDTEIMEMTKDKPELVYHEHPTKEDLLEYFGQRIRIRKMTPKTALRLMDVDDADIDKIMNATEKVTLKDGSVRVKKAISKTAVYKLAGNSIVASCLYHIFRTLFIPDQPENWRMAIRQMTIFDYL